MKSRTTHTEQCKERTDREMSAIRPHQEHVKAQIRTADRVFKRLQVGEQEEGDGYLDTSCSACESLAPPFSVD